MGPLCHQLQQLLKQQERMISVQADAVVKVLSCGADGQILRAYCQLESVSNTSPEPELPSTFLVLLKTDPRIEASPGSLISISKPWQSISVDDMRVLMVRHAEVQRKY